MLDFVSTVSCQICVQLDNILRFVWLSNLIGITLIGSLYIFQIYFRQSKHQSNKKNLRKEFTSN